MYYLFLVIRYAQFLVSIKLISNKKLIKANEKKEFMYFPHTNTLQVDTINRID